MPSVATLLPPTTGLIANNNRPTKSPASPELHPSGRDGAMPDGRRPTGTDRSRRGSSFVVLASRFTPGRDERGRRPASKKAAGHLPFVYVRDVNMSGIIRWPAIKWWV